MAKKTNIRSIRITDEILELIEAQAGENFTQKYEALIRRCIFELPYTEERLEQLNREIDRKKEIYKELNNEVNKLKITLREITKNMNQLQNAVETAIKKHM